MKHTCFYSRYVGKIALLLTIIVLAAWPLVAQQYLQVMVAGPWSFVADNSPPGRLLLVAPGNSTTHKAYLIAGANPLPPYSAPINPGIYTLNLLNPSGQYTAPPLIHPALCAASVNSTTPNYKNALSASNYVISLPMPAAYSTYTGSMGTSESEVSAVPTTATNHAPPTQYTTWMILYYPQAEGLVDQNKNQYADGASIVFTDYPNENDNYCDHVSLASVNERNLLWNINQYVRFPELVTGGTGMQIPGVYDYAGCSDSDPTIFRHTPRTPSSADCHACQLDVNGVVNLNADTGAKVFDLASTPKKK